MNRTTTSMLVAMVLSLGASLLMLHIGSRLLGQRYLVRLGKTAHQRKLRALDRIWPLTRVRPALADGNTTLVTAVLSTLILVKSAASLVFGIVMVFWLPLASLIVPAIVYEHDPDNPGLAAWVRRVAALQVTSHVLAAAVGFAAILTGPLAGVTLYATIESNLVSFAVPCALSFAFALAAGGAEATGLARHGI
jgi:hypothetical protein